MKVDHEKWVEIFVAFLSILFSVFAFLQISNYAVEEVLLNKQIISFDFREDRSVSMPTLLRRVKNFSDKYDVEIAQYSFLSKNKIDIYSTDKEDYRELLSIPNLIFNRNIKVHDFEDLLDTGFKNRFYVATNDKEIINQLAKELSEDGRVYCSDSRISGGVVRSGQIRDQTLIYGGLIYICTLTIIIFVCCFLWRTKSLIYELWGYQLVRIFYIFNRRIWALLFFPGVLAGSVLTGIVYRFNYSVAGRVLRTLLGLNGLVVLIICFLSIPLFCCFCTTSIVNRAKRFSRLMMLCSIIKILAVLMVMVLLGLYIRKSDTLKEQKNRLIQWNDTQDLFNIFEAYSPSYMSDMAEEDIYNRKIYAVYQQLSDSEKEFILNTMNFEHPEPGGLSGKNRNVQYNYQLDMNSEDDEYTPYGRSITVDCNYLKTHTILDMDGNNVLKQINTDDLVLNVLVPHSLINHENTIRGSFADWFYYQKVEVSNMYREARNLDQSEIRAKDLAVNLVYVQDGNQIFTYNVNSGDKDNRIEDPIIMVYTGNVDNSYLASCLGGFIFMKAPDEYSALREISSITGKFDIPELNLVRSVYDQKGEEIEAIEDNKRSLSIGVFVIFIMLNLVLGFSAYVYWQRFLKEIVLRSLFGYRYVQIYSQLIVRNVMMNFAAILPAAAVLGSLSIYMSVVAAGVSVIDYLIPRIVNYSLITKGVHELSMGG